MLDVLAAVHANRGRAAGPRPGVDRSIRTVGYLISGPDPNTYLATVSVLDSEPIPGVPATPSTYTGVTTVHVLLDPNTGRPVQVLGPAGALPVDQPGAPVYVPPPPAPTPEATRTVTGKVITPTWSGTWRASRAAWDRWNVTGDVYQAGSASSGPLTGLATYGSQVTALDARVITRARLTLVSNGAGHAASWRAQIQGSPSGSRPAGAPSFTGATNGVNVPGYGRTGAAITVDLTADVREALRTGSIRGLGLTGTEYGGTMGTRNSRAWTLTLDYEVTD